MSDAGALAPAPDAVVARLPFRVVHYGKNDPETHVGGVETFARNLRLIFDEVSFMWPKRRDFEWVRRERVPVICDNHWVLDLPKGLPAIAFQHGVADVKRHATGRWADWRVAMRQGKAAKRANTLWVACAEWISSGFASRYGNRANHVIYHQVDLQRFDGRRDAVDPKLVLHDARTEGKGSTQVKYLAEHLTEWRFEPLACKPHEVPARMSKAAAFVHLSRYEGNSIVCNEAMAQDLPCLFTRVGLMQDANGPTEVAVVDPAVAFGDPAGLLAEAQRFLSSLATREYHPRRWVQQNASRERNVEAWRAVMNDFEGMWP